MTLDLGWQGMQSKFWVGVLSFAGLALVAFAQDEGVEATSNKTGITQVTPGSGGASAVSEYDEAPRQQLWRALQTLLSIALMAPKLRQLT